MMRGYKILTKDGGLVIPHGEVPTLIQAVDAIKNLAAKAIGYTDVRYRADGSPYIGAFGFMAFAQPIPDLQCSSCGVYESQDGDDFHSIQGRPLCFSCWNSETSDSFHDDHFSHHQGYDY